MVGIGAVCSVGGVGGRTARDCGTRRCATMVQAHGQGRGAAACSSATMLLPGCRGALWVSAARRGPRRGGGAARSFFGEDQEKQLQKMIQDAERAEQTNTEEEQFGESSFFFFGGGGGAGGPTSDQLNPCRKTAAQIGVTLTRPRRLSHLHFLGSRRRGCRESLASRLHQPVLLHCDPALQAQHSGDRVHHR